MKAEKFIIRLIIFVAAILVLAVGAWLVLKQADSSRTELPVLGNLPDFEFVKQDGRPFGKSDMLGSISVVDFIFTRCKGPCPIMSGYMAELYEVFKKAPGVRFVSITVDPEYDSLSVLKAYASDKGVTDGRWVFLWAPVDSVVWLSESGFMLAAEDLPGGHTTKWALVDALANIRGYYSGTDEASIEILRSHIAELVKQLP